MHASWVLTSILKLVRTHYGGKKSKTQVKATILQRHGLFFFFFLKSGKSADGLGSASSWPSGGTVPALGAEKDAQYGR